MRVLDANMNKKRDSFPHHWFFDYTLQMLETICCWLISCSVVSAAQHSAAKEHIHSNNDENTIDSWWWWWCWRVIYILHQFCNRKRKNNSLFDVHHNCILHEQLIQKFKHQGASRIKERAPLPPPPPHTLYNTNSICFCAVFFARFVHLLAILAILIRLKMSALYNVHMLACITPPKNRPLSFMLSSCECVVLQ